MSARNAPRGRRRKVQEEEGHGDRERWLVTYADMLTLLLVLFIVLYAMSVVDPTKFVQLRTGLTAVFNPGQNAVLSQTGGITSTDQGGSETVQSVTPDLTPKNKSASKSVLDKEVATALAAKDRAKAEQEAKHAQQEVNRYKAIQKAITDALKKAGMAGTALFTIDERGLVVTIVTNTLVFGGNSAELLAGGQHILDQVVPPLLPIANSIEVDGHTNQQNVSTYPYPSGWELSSARASAVVRYLVDGFNFPQSRLRAVGFSDQKPLYSPSDPRSITRNRRVDIVVLSKLTAAERALLPVLGGETTP